MNQASVLWLFIPPQCFQTPVNRASVFSLFMSLPCVLVCVVFPDTNESCICIFTVHVTTVFPDTSESNFCIFTVRVTTMCALSFQTPMNQASSRSHCIFTIHVTARETGSATIRRAKFHLVDLAGWVSGTKNICALDIVYQWYCCNIPQLNTLVVQ